MPKIYRRPSEAKCLGVLSGLAQHFHWSLALVRLLFLLFALLNPLLALLAYAGLALWIKPYRSQGQRSMQRAKKVRVKS